MTRSATRWMLLGLAFVLTLAGITPMVDAHGGDPTLIHSCVNKSSGEVKIVGASASCKNNENAVDWPATAAPPPPPAGGGSIMVHGVGAGVVATPFFVHFGGGVPEYRLPRDGTVQNMRILVTSNTYNAPTTVTLFVNGAATALSATIPGSSTADIDVVGTVPVLDGQRVSVMADASTVSSGSIALSVSYEIQ
jgi:hypothetical protein